MTSPRAQAGVGRTIPALPARDVAAGVEFYGERLGFEVLHHDDGFAVLRRDEAVLHLWQADDEGWRERGGESPVESGAEAFLAGTASCRIETTDVEALFEELSRREVLHPTSRGGVVRTDFGTREFHVLDVDGNLISFYRWVT
jgi:catechol 2,3-dioxygenase-like lactoylglutathione lyase family enzyme